MAILNSVLRLSLLDQVTGRAKVINSSLNSIRATQSALIGTFGRVAAFGAAYLGVTAGITGTVGAAREMQAALSEIGIKSDLTGGQIEQLRGRMLKLAPAVNQATSELIGGIDTMVTMGLGVNDAAAAMPAIGKAATATKSSITDLSSATVSAMQNLGVASGDIAKMLDGMASAGNAGAFEMRDMAQYFPELTASAKALGMTGVDSIMDMAAALQIARRGAGDASTAANNMSNFMGKIMAPATIKNFKKFGVDVTKELQKAHKKGISPIEHFIQLVDDKTEGGRADLLGQLFGDKQVLEFVRPMLSDFKDYIKIRTDAEKASGTVADAYSRRMQDANEKIKAFQIRIENLGATVGAKLLGPLASVADYFTNIFDTADHRVTVFDKLTSAVKGFVAGLGFDGSDGLKSLGDMIFGIAGKDGTAAGEELGRIAYKFRQFGDSVKKVADAVKNSPIASFMTELAAAIGVLAMSKWGRLFIIAYGISSLISAVKDAGSIGEFVEQLKNLSAMEWAGIGVGFLLLAGKVRSLVRALKELRSFTPKVPPKPGAPASGTPPKPTSTPIPGGKPGTTGPWGRVPPKNALPQGTKVTPTGPKIGGGAPAATPGFSWKGLTGGLAGGAVQALILAAGEKAISMGFKSVYGDKYVQPQGLMDSFKGTIDAWRDLLSSGNSMPQPSVYAATALDAARGARQFGIGGNTTETLPGKTADDLGMGQRPVKIDASSIGALTRPTAEQPVRVTNQQPPPNINITNSFVINEATNGKALADQAAQGLDKALRDAAEGSFKYGAY